MTDHRIETVTHDWDRFPELLALSFDVLYRQFGVSEDADWYHPAHGSEFAIALDADNRLLGSARLLPAPGDAERQVRQVAVAHDAHGRGIGRELMLSLEQIARREDAAELWLNARSLAFGFYQRLGFEFDGEEFVSELTGIPHRLMRKRLI